MACRHTALSQRSKSGETVYNARINQLYIRYCSTDRLRLLSPLWTLPSPMESFKTNGRTTPESSDVQLGLLPPEVSH